MVIFLGGSDNVIGGTEEGEGNTIAYNLIGVDVQSGTGNRILGNAIHTNGGVASSRLGIDLANDGVTANDAGDADAGPNRLQNFPVLTSAEVAAGRDDRGHARQRRRLVPHRVLPQRHLRPLGHGEGAEFLGALEGQAPGAFAFPVALAAGDVITATATDEATGDTSEFSACETSVSALPNDPPVVDAGADAAGTEGASVALSGSATDRDDKPDHPVDRPRHRHRRRRELHLRATRPPRSRA